MEAEAEGEYRVGGVRLRLTRSLAWPTWLGQKVSFVAPTAYKVILLEETGPSCGGHKIGHALGSLLWRLARGAKRPTSLTTGRMPAIEGPSGP